MQNAGRSARRLRERWCSRRGVCECALGEGFGIKFALLLRACGWFAPPHCSAVSEVEGDRGGGEGMLVDNGYRQWKILFERSR